MLCCSNAGPILSIVAVVLALKSKKNNGGEFTKQAKIAFYMSLSTLIATLLLHVLLLVFFSTIMSHMRDLIPF